jgi:glycerophosphoryl diester phosphodiesterase
MKQVTIAIFTLIMAITSVKAQKLMDNWNKNIVIAHRGAWKKNNLPENSIAALKQAFKLNCYGSEFDVHLTQDSVLVVNHDPTFLGLDISKSTYKELLTKKLANGETIPTVEAYLKAGMKQQKTKLILEIKPQNMGKERDLLITEKALQLVRKLKAQHWVEYISFGYDICTYIIKNEPNAKVAYLNGDATPEKMKADGFTGVDYHFSVYQKNQDYIERFRKVGLSINGWTANTPEAINFLIANRVEYITTNEPELVFDLVKQASAVKK